jgi:hypothetical protein
MDHLRKEFTKDVGLAVVYCNYKEQEMQTPLNLVSSILRQLYDGIPLSDKAKVLHRKHDERKTRPTLAEISELLRIEIDRFSTAFVIVDALDECTDEHHYRQSLLEQLHALQPKVHLMITSRPEVPATPNSLQLEIVATKKDLERYIDGKRSGAKRLNNLLRGQDDWRKIRETVIEKADGMYVSKPQCLSSYYLTVRKGFCWRKSIWMRSPLPTPGRNSHKYWRIWQRI